ncbi:MAG: MBL fold metallo-hydrolase [bacterium]|nr:MBL fold metallo-hydrolase [bacterium]
MKITKHMQSCFVIETGATKILIDPGTFVFNEEGLTPEAFKNIPLLIFTHEHADHFDWENVKKIIDLNDPKIIATSAIIDLVNQDYSNHECVELKPGAVEKFNDITIEGYESTHGPLPNGKPAPTVIGIVIDDGQTRFYTPGDSINLNPQARADITAVPICGQVVMDIPSAKEQLLQTPPKLAIPMHYDNPQYPTNVNDFVQAMQDTGIEVRVLNSGEETIYGSL